MASTAELIELLRGYAQRYGINENIAIAQINQESRFNPGAGSPAGAQGIAQFMPATARRFGVDVWDVNSSFDGWGRYMRWLLDRYNGNYSFALAGYNAGEGNVDKYGGIPPFAETQAYVRNILAAANVAPPQNDWNGLTGGVDAETYTNDWPIENLAADSGVGASLLIIGVIALVGLIVITR